MSCGCNNNGWGGGCGCQGTVQFAPPPCNPNFPTTCTPLGAGNIQRVIGEDSASCKYTVPTFSAKSLLSYNSDTGLINWADGSSGNPISLPNLQTGLTTYVTGINPSGKLSINTSWYSDLLNTSVRLNSSSGVFNVQTPDGSGGFNTELSVNSTSINAGANAINNVGSLTVNNNGYVSIGSRTETTRSVSNITLLGFTNSHGYGIYFEPTADPATPIGFFNSSGSVVGTIYTTSSSTAYNTSSDYRLKENQVPITNGLARIENLPVYQFNWKTDPSGAKVDGFFAHEAQAVVPESVTGKKDAVDNDGKPIYQAIDQSKLVPLLVAAVKELKAITDAQSVTIASLQQSITNTNS